MRLRWVIAAQTLRTRAGIVRRRQHLASPCEWLISPLVGLPAISRDDLPQAIINLFHRGSMHLPIDFSITEGNLLHNTEKPSDSGGSHDPIAVAPAAHPVESGIDAALGGAVVGAATGTIAAGPVGTVVGAAVGAIVGGLAGKSSADSIDPSQEEDYWRKNYLGRPYVDTGASYDDYGPAYGYGVDAYARYPDRSFSDVEADLSSGWDTARGKSTLGWDRAKNATRDAWQRVSDSVER